jgi:hypothetical protein
MTRGAAVVVAMCALLAGCEKELSLALPAEPVMLQRYERGRPVEACEISPESPQFASLAAWISKNGDGWSSSPASYAPGVLVSGRNFSINFLSSLVVVNYPGGQLTRKASSNEAAFLNCPRGT